jgi:hypothetical protein
MTPESKPEKSEWMQIAESDNASSNVRKVDKRLTLGTLASVGAIVIAGSLFANASDDPSVVSDIKAIADITPVTTNVSSTASAPAKATSTLSAVTPQVAKIQAPAISQMPTGAGDDDDEDGDHEGRDRGGDHDDDDDDDEDDD